MRLSTTTLLSCLFALYQVQAIQPGLKKRDDDDDDDDNLKSSFIYQLTEGDVTNGARGTLKLGSNNETLSFLWSTSQINIQISASNVSSDGYDYKNSKSFIDVESSEIGVQAFDIFRFDEGVHHSNTTFALRTNASYGLESPNIAGVERFLITLLNNDVIDSSVGAIYKEKGSSAGGSISFGLIDYDLLEDKTLTSFPNILTPDGDNVWWSLKTFDLTLGCNASSIFQDNTYRADIATDSGVGIQLPQVVFNNLVNALDGYAAADANSTSYYFPCANAADLTFDFGGYEVDVPADFYAYQLDDTKTCQIYSSAIQPIEATTEDDDDDDDDDDDQAISLGWPFFDFIFVAEDFENEQILLGKPVATSASTSDVITFTDLGVTIPSTSQAASYSNNATTQGNTAVASIPTSSGVTFTSLNSYSAAATCGSSSSAVASSTLATSTSSSASSSSASVSTYSGAAKRLNNGLSGVAAVAAAFMLI